MDIAKKIYEGNTEVINTDLWKDKVKFRDGLISASVPVENKYFKLETLRWNCKPCRGVYSINEKIKLTYDDEKYLIEFLKYFVPFLRCVELNGIPNSSSSKITKNLPMVKESKTQRTPITPKLKMEVWCEEGNRTEGLQWRNRSLSDHKSRSCFACLQRVNIDSCDVAHIVPYCLGGKDEVSNLRISCANCNKGRKGMGTMHAYEWMIVNDLPGLNFIDPSDPHYTTALALYLFSELDKQLPGKNVKTKLPVPNRMMEYYNKIVNSLKK
ncbi:MAG: hypothetical protein KatS3mg101_0849 [Patescibacteria group bacterium]|nr:MAG: hypothetical protein KatS3mg101_0849 [Patescibacteria group bacterium]